MLNPQLNTLSRQSGPAQGVGPAVTAYVGDMPEILAGGHPLFGALADLDATVTRFSADTRVLVVVHQAAGGAGSTR